uniref:GATOR1 complex protein NPRL3 C-terminal HTH domain-containing protein n=1 Tax=Phytophthora ramorum TaxID=164328 RepID=H3HC47_PHYRM
MAEELQHLSSIEIDHEGLQSHERDEKLPQTVGQVKHAYRARARDQEARETTNAIRKRERILELRRGPQWRDQLSKSKAQNQQSTAAESHAVSPQNEFEQELQLIDLPVDEVHMNTWGFRVAGGCRLLGVALVVDDISKGCNLAFRYPASPSENVSSFHSLPAPLLAKLFRPKNALCNASFELVVDDLRFADEEELLARRRSSAQAFHTLRVGFVSKEVRELLQLRDELAQTGATSGSSITSNAGGAATSGSSLMHHHLHRKDGENGSSTVEVDPQTLIDVSLGKSVLANDLKRVFHGLEESGAAHVVLNGWVKLSLTLTDAVTVRMASLRPYHTLLLLADKDSILNKLPADHARQLRDLVEAVNPLKSFQDLALETGVPIHQVFRLAAHLVYWGFGRIVDAITLYNIYQVNAKADLHITSPLAQEFRRKFAPYELGEVLSTFSGSRRIGEYMKTLSTAKKTEYIHMLIWLLQQRFIVQLHRYIYFMIPSDGDYAAEVMSVASQLLFTDQERAYLAKIAKPNPVFTLFKRLCVYFHGEHHIEEIMWRENLSRGELRTVMSTYQDIIVCCLHE